MHFKFTILLLLLLLLTSAYKCEDYDADHQLNATFAHDSDDFRVLNVGVLMASHLDSPFDLERCGPAVDLALERVNEEFLRSHKVRLHKVQGR